VRADLSAQRQRVLPACRCRRKDDHVYLNPSYVRSANHSQPRQSDLYPYQTSLEVRLFFIIIIIIVII